MVTMHDVEIEFRPMDHSTWVDDGAPDRKRSTFKVAFYENVRLLKREIANLGADFAVLEIDYDGCDLRLDGMPRAGTKAKSPRVRVSFEAPSIGPLCYMCDTYRDWHSNLRAISLTLERLRAIERYGATRNQQQYRGWAALPEKSGGAIRSKDEAAKFLLDVSAFPADELSLHELARGIGLNKAYRMAAHNAHPDKPGGSNGLMARVNEAKEMILSPSR